MISRRAFMATAAFAPAALRRARASELFPADLSVRCLRHDIATCLGPCAGLCSRKEYAANVRAATA